MSMTNHVRITLGEREFDLVPNLKAATAISNRFGGFQNALSAVANSDLAAITYVVRQGIPLKAMATEQLGEEVYDAGTRQLMDSVLRFITRLANGGRDPDEEQSDEGERDEGNGEV